MSDIEQLEQSITALEAQRAILGDAVVGPALAAMRQQLATLKAAHAPADQQRKLVTILFADLAGFTPLSETLDPEEVRTLVDAYFQAVTPPILHYGGRIEKFIGDAILAVFGIPTGQESDPGRAVRAALAMQAELESLRLKVESPHRSTNLHPATSNLHMRIGINTGLIVADMLRAEGGEVRVVGDAVNLASRLQSAAPPDGILIAHNTYRLVRGIFDVQALDPLHVKGKAEPVQAYVVKGAKPRAFHLGARGIEGIETRFIGRETELKTLQNAFETVTEEREVQMVTVVGEPGVGKSRLLSEFETWLDVGTQKVWYFKGRADESTQRLPYALLRDLFGFRFQIPRQ